MTDKIVLYCTAPTVEDAGAIARRLVEERLAACVNIVPQVQSVYRWEGAVEEATELLLIIKTRAGLYGEVEAEIRKLHPYEVPEIIALPVERGLVEYLAWVEGETARE